MMITWLLPASTGPSHTVHAALPAPLIMMIITWTLVFAPPSPVRTGGP